MCRAGAASHRAVKATLLCVLRVQPCCFAKVLRMRPRPNSCFPPSLGVGLEGTDQQIWNPHCHPQYDFEGRGPCPGRMLESLSEGRCPLLPRVILVFIPCPIEMFRFWAFNFIGTVLIVNVVLLEVFTVRVGVSIVAVAIYPVLSADPAELATARATVDAKSATALDLKCHCDTHVM